MSSESDPNRRSEPDRSPAETGVNDRVIKQGVRPIPLTIFCALGFMSFPLYLSQYGAAHLRDMEFAINGREHFHWFFVIYGGFLVGYLGLWLMRRWGFNIFVLAVIAMGVHQFIGTRNMVDFREQLIAEEAAIEAGVPLLPELQRFDSSFLEGAAFQALPDKDGRTGQWKKGESQREAIVGAPAHQPWLVFVLGSLPPLFVIFIAILVRDRFR